MPCDRSLKKNQTLQERAQEIRKVVDLLGKGLANGRIKTRIGPQGAIAFEGLTEAERDGVTDACAYRRLLASGSPMALAAITRAEQMAGRTIDRQAVAIGAHSHDGGRSWHAHKG